MNRSVVISGNVANSVVTTSNNVIINNELPWVKLSLNERYFRFAGFFGSVNRVEDGVAFTLIFNGQEVLSGKCHSFAGAIATLEEYVLNYGK